MANKKPFWFMLDVDLAQRLEGAKAKTGLSIAEQIRLAIRSWLEAHEWQVTPRLPRGRDDAID
jgi:hypothetical protein